MHGRPRTRATAAADKESEAKAERFELLLSAVLRNHQQRCYTKEALEENARLVELNPEVYTAWNFRKLALKSLLDAEPDEDSRKDLVKQELKVTENALRAHIKSYSAWHHRKWVIALGLSSLDDELDLLAQLFKVDARNFNAWSYRRYIVGLMGVPVQQELDYTMTLLNKNFSNYSAWHNRSALLLELFKEIKDEQGKESILSEEFELVKQALYTDPCDQSGWFYHSWLLGHSSKQDRLGTEIDMCRDLLEAEEDASDWARNTLGEESKFPRLTLARLLSSAPGVDKAEVVSLYDRLVRTDPPHAAYYKDMLQKSRTTEEEARVL
ncbi:geranylgeranyl transferase type-2 subunit alpha 1 [Selaginella moellendorffii]|uniref:geranylgeranyl transferase type-2 subunit alpha 1 n=1 Tax=Selaginella moellendorffii TaxID=88036 RepID=UPI000D1CF99C|nr:geranylgeranyl transferase type-2 subunit alpha 1 [Selaginella moellendorffii]|eukprot:XP_024515674.1 geranylgeranyl transferase type-2 subunit alpha 1 [Selaginella moellendorffii]